MLKRLRWWTEPPPGGFVFPAGFRPDRRACRPSYVQVAAWPPRAIGRTTRSRGAPRLEAGRFHTVSYQYGAHNAVARARTGGCQQHPRANADSQRGADRRAGAWRARKTAGNHHEGRRQCVRRNRSNSRLLHDVLRRHGRARPDVTPPPLRLIAIRNTLRRPNTQSPSMPRQQWWLMVLGTRSASPGAGPSRASTTRRSVGFAGDHSSRRDGRGRSWRGRPQVVQAVRRRPRSRRFSQARTSRSMLQRSLTRSPTAHDHAERRSAAVRDVESPVQDRPAGARSLGLQDAVGRRVRRPNRTGESGEGAAGESSRE